MNEYIYLDVFANKDGSKPSSRSISPCGIKTLLNIIGLGASNNLLTKLINMYGTHYDMIEYIIKMDKMKDSKDIKLYNGLFIINSSSLSSKFKNNIEKYVELNNLSDYNLEKLNGLIKQNTNINDFFNQEEIDNAVFILLNTLAFKDDWINKFNIMDTHQSFFNCYDGSLKNIQMMYQENNLNCHIADDIQAVKLPFTNGAYAEFIMGLPSNVDSNNIKTLSYRTYKCELYLPKFKHEETINLIPVFKNDELKESNLKELFEGGNLTNMYNDPALFISSFKQKNICSFDENGGEVKAVTSIVGRRCLKIIEECTLNFNKPFHYRVIKNNEILISGFYNGD